MYAYKNYVFLWLFEDRENQFSQFGWTVLYLIWETQSRVLHRVVICCRVTRIKVVCHSLTHVRIIRILRNVCKVVMSGRDWEHRRLDAE